MSKMQMCDEDLMEMSVDEILGCCARVSSNSRKTLGIMYLRDIIVEVSSRERPVSQKALAEILDRCYHIRKERKALSRDIRTLESESNLCIHVTNRGSVYYDANEASENKQALRRYLAA